MLFVCRLNLNRKYYLALPLTFAPFSYKLKRLESFFSVTRYILSILSTLAVRLRHAKKVETI